RGFTALIAQALERNARDVNAEVDPVEHRTGQLPAVTLDLVRKASALAFGITPEATRTRVHRRHEDEPRGIRRRTACARDRDGALLERLAERVEDAPREFGDLIQKERATVSEADF